MKNPRQQTYYEKLEVPHDASPLEIRRAYKKLFELYQDESLASYSFFSEEDRKEILSDIEEAYLTLINTESRMSYDDGLIALGRLPEEKSYRDAAKEPVPIYHLQKKTMSVASSGRRKEELQTLASRTPAVREILSRDALTGADLEKLRAALEVPLEEIAESTNIRIDILRAMEGGDPATLPPAVYLKGFVKSYARCLALDEHAVAEKYMKGTGKNE